MKKTITIDGETFFTNKIAGLIEHYKAPDIRYIPNSNKTQHYAIYSLGQKTLSRKGNIAIKRTVLDKNFFRLKIDCIRDSLNGFNYYTSAEMFCTDNILSTPVFWKWTSKIAKSLSDEAYLNSEMTKEASVNEEILQIVAKGKIKSESLKGMYTCKWCLFDAVQHINGEDMEPICFHLIDEFDQIKKIDILSYFGKIKVVMQEKFCELSIFLLKGSGVIPTAYYVEKTGRLLFVTSGLEIYALEHENRG